MNKMIKGSVAGATGIVLLMGGFGTYALWSDSNTLEGGSVTSGDLDIATQTATWADVTPGAANTLWDPANDKVVPGDVIQRTQLFTVTGHGKNLRGTIKLTGGAVDEGGFASVNPAYDWMDVGVAITRTNGSAEVTPDTSTSDLNDFVFSAPFGTAELTAVVTYTFGNATAQQAQKATASMDAATLTIAQTALPAPSN